jgi:hypothetical protein
VSRRSLYSIVVSLGVLAGGCASESSAQVASAAVVRDDTASVLRLLDGVRGVNPLACELATRSVDMHGSWSRWGSLGGNPLEVDSASAALIAWIQRDHKDPAVVPRLRAAMRDNDRCVRRVAASFLGRVEHPSAVSALLSNRSLAACATNPRPCAGSRPGRSVRSRIGRRWRRSSSCSSATRILA